MARLQEDMRRLRFWRSLIGEFLGSMFLVLIGCGSWAQGDSPDHPDSVRIALAFGLTYTAVLFCIRSVSDGHINPAVTLAMLATRKASVIRSLLYLACQLLGALLGAAFVLAITSTEYRVKFPHAIGCTVLSEHVAESHGFGVEFFATFFFVFVVFACYEKKSLSESGGDGMTSFVIGLTYAAVSLFAIPYTGGSINPARSFGPALVSGVWADHWIYWFGPILGGVTGGATYDLVFSTKSSFKRLQACLLVFHRGDDPESQKPKREPGDDLDDEGKEVVIMTDPNLEAVEELNPKAENSGNEDQRPSRSKLFRPKFPCCNKDGH